MSVTRGRYSFHSRAGQLAQITNDGVTARRKESRIYLDNAVLIGAQPLEDGKMFEVLIQEKVTRWLGLIGGSIAIGCTTSRPEAVSLPNSLSSFRQDSWIMLGSALVKHGRQQIKNYGQDLNSLNVKDTVGIARIGRQLKFYVNGTDQGTAEDNLPPVVYPMVDLYGKCTRISILSPGKLYSSNSLVNQSLLQDVRDRALSMTQQLIYGEKCNLLYKDEKPAVCLSALFSVRRLLRGFYPDRRQICSI